MEATSPAPLPKLVLEMGPEMSSCKAGSPSIIMVNLPNKTFYCLGAVKIFMHVLSFPVMSECVAESLEFEPHSTLVSVGVGYGTSNSNAYGRVATKPAIHTYKLIGKAYGMPSCDNAINKEVLERQGKIFETY